MPNPALTILPLSPQDRRIEAARGAAELEVGWLEFLHFFKRQQPEP